MIVKTQMSIVLCALFRYCRNLSARQGSGGPGPSWPSHIPFSLRTPPHIIHQSSPNVIRIVQILGRQQGRTRVGSKVGHQLCVWGGDSQRLVLACEHTNTRSDAQSSTPMPYGSGRPPPLPSYKIVPSQAGSPVGILAVRAVAAAWLRGIVARHLPARLGT